MRPIRALALALSAAVLLAVPSTGQQDPFAITADLAGQAVFSAATLVVNGSSTVDSAGAGGGSGNQGHVVSNSDIVLNGAVRVKGDATCGPGKRVQKNGGATVSGITSALTTPRNPVPISLQGLDVQLAAQNDNSRIGKTNKNQSPLKGASKTEFSLNGNETITIPAGTYYFTKITINGSSQLNLSGLTRILCTGTITINGNSTVNAGGTPSQLRLWTSGRFTTLNGGSALKGVLYGPLTATTIDGSSVLTGTVFSAGVTINGGARVTRSVDDAPALAVSITNAGQPIADGSVHRSNVTPVVTVTGGTPPVTTSLTLDGNGFSSGTLVSGEGTHRLAVVVTDQAGRRLETSVTFVIDKSAPNIAVVSPASGSVVAATPIDVYGTCEDAVSVTVNGASVTPSGGSFLVRGIPLAEGGNTLTVSATDPVGNARTATFSVVLDSLAPSLTVSAPAPGSLTNGETIVVQGVVSDPHLAAFTVGGSAVTVPPGGGPFAAATPLGEGANTILVEARDVVGHVTARSVSVVRDSVKPVLRIEENGARLEAGRSYNRDLTVAIGVVEAHPGTLSVLLDGTAFTSGGTVSAEGEHTLNATAEDGAGNSESATVHFTIDKTAPSIAITVPAPGSTVRSLPQALEGTSGDAVSVEVNGTSATPAAGRFAIAAFPFVEGPATLTATGTDAAGNTGTAAATYLVDTEAPLVAILAPAEAAILGAAPVFVTGTATDANLLDVTVNGQPASLGSDGTFRAGPFGPADGPVTFTATATDRASRSSSATRNVIVDTVPPEISIRNAGTSAPIPADSLFNAPITVAASVTDLTTPTQTTHTTTLDGSAYAGGPVTSEGSHRVEVVATDGAGNTSTASVTFALDTTKPVFSAVLPAEGTIGRTTPVTVSGQVSVDTESVTVAGQSATYAGGAFSRSDVALLEGPNDILLVAADLAGNQGTSTLRLVLDTTSPTITIAAPAEGALVGSLAVTVSGSVTDANLDTVLVEGGAAALEPGGGFSRTGVTLAEGPNTLTATAKDKAGNTATATVHVAADSLPPTIAITAPGSGAVLGQSPAIVSGTAVDAHLESVVVNGVVAVVGPADRFTASVPLTEGTNTLTVTARDTLNHSAQASVVVSLDSAAPSVAITAPQDGTRFRTTPQTVRGTVDSAANLEGVTVNGVAAALTGTSFEASVSLLEGTNTLTARARKATGKEGTAKIDVVLDTTAPAFLSSSPADGQSGVVLAPEIRLTFSEALDASTVTNSVFVLTTPGGPAVPLSESLGGASANVVTLVPAAPLLEAHAYALSVPASLKDLAGNALSGSVTVGFTTVDQTAPPAPTVDPVPALLCAPTLTLAGTSEAGALISVSGGAAGTQGTAGTDGRFTVTVALSPGTAQTLSVTARDVSGNLSAPTTVSVTVDCEPPHVVDVVSSTSGIVVTFDEPALPSTIVAGDTVRLDGSGGTSIPVLPVLSDGDKTLTVTAIGVDLSTIGFTLSLSSGVTDLAGNALTPFVRTFEPPSTSTLLLGEVYDDAIGRPLGGATATLLVSGGVETPEPRPYATATVAGSWALPTVSGDALVRVRAPGYLDVFRRDSVVAGASASPISSTLFDTRLTPVAEPATASATAAGALYRADFGPRTVTLEAPSGSLPSGAVVRLTLRRPQGTPVLAPLGWSVASAVQLSISDASGSPLAATGGMTLSVPDFYGATSSTPLVLARLDETSLQWLNQGSATLEAGLLRASVSSAGDWAVFVPDPAPTAPASPALGAPLPGVDLPEEDPLESATVVADPVDVLPSQTSDVALTVASPQPVPSGYPVQVLVTEELTLLDGSHLAGPSFLADLVLLRRGDGTLGLTIPVRSSEGASRVALSVGYERFAVKRFPFEVRRGVVVGASGGTVTGASGWSATLPAGAVSGPTSVSLTALGLAELPAGVPSGFDFLAAVRLSTGGVDFGLPITLSYVTSAPPPAGRDILVVAFEDRGGFLVARPVARASYDAASQTLRSNAIDRAAFPWPGVRGEGTFAFLVARDPLAYAAGRALDVDTAPLRDTLVSAGGGWTLQAVSENDGTFALAIRAVVSTLAAVRIETGNVGLVTVSPSAPGQEITGIELRLAHTAPWVAGVTPSAGSTVLVGAQFTVSFSESVDPLSVTPTSFFLVATVDGAPVVVPAEIRIDPSGLSATLVPAGALPGNTPLALGVARTVRDRNGYALVDAITKQPADFAVAYTTEDLTPPDAKPYLVRFGLPTGDPNPTVTISGAPGAVCPGCHVAAYNDTTLATASTDALSDGSFTLTLPARATDAIRVVVEKANGTKQTLPPVPFTNDGGRTALVGSKGGTWETPDGFRVTVPAAAFAGPMNIVTERIPQATFQTLVAEPRDVSFVDSFQMDFPNPATTGFDLSFAAPATSVTDQFFLAQVVEALGQRRLMVVDLLEMRNGRLVTNRSGSLQSLRQQGYVALVDPKSTAVGGVIRVDAQLLSVGALGGPGSQIDDPKSFFDGVFQRGQYAVYNAAVRMAIVAGALGAGATVATSSSSDFLFASNEALNRTYFRLLCPVGRAFDLTLVDHDSGLVLFEGSYGAPTGTGTVVLVDPPSPDKVRPGVLEAGPARVYRFDSPVPGTSSPVARGIVARSAISGESDAVTVSIEGGVIPRGALLRLVNFSRASLGAETVSTGEATSLTLQGARRGESLALVSENVSAPFENSLLIRFDEAMKPMGKAWTSRVFIENRASLDGSTCSAVGFEVVEKATAGPGVQELLLLPLIDGSAWIRSGCRYALLVKREVADLAGNEMASDFRAEFSLPGDDPIATQASPSPGFVRKVLYHGGLLLTTGEEQVIRVFDARVPGSIGNTCDMQAPLAPSSTSGPCPSGATTPLVPLPGVGRDLAVDRFGRLIVVGGGTADSPGASPGLGFLRLYDFVPTCGNPSAGCGRRLAARGTTVISANVGGDTISYPPQGIPRKIALQEEVQEHTWRVDADDNTASQPPMDARTTVRLTLPVPTCDPPAQGSAEQILTIQKTGANGKQGHRQRYFIASDAAFPPSPRCHKLRFFSFTNTATGETVHARTDENGAGLYARDGAVGVSLRASSGDRIRMIANGASVALVDVLGYGLAVVDLDAVYEPNDVAGQPPTTSDPTLAAKLLLAYRGSSSSTPVGRPCADSTDTSGQKTCDEPYQRCGAQGTCNLLALIESEPLPGHPPAYSHVVNDLLALTGIAIKKTKTPGLAWAFGSLNGFGLLTFSIDLRATDESGDSHGGMGRERTFAFGSGQATIRAGHPIGLVSAFPLEVPNSSPRANDVVLVEGLAPPAKPRFCTAWRPEDHPKDLAFVAAGDHGVFIVDVTDPGLPEVLGRFGTKGGALAVSADASRKLLYVSDAGEGMKVFSFEDPCGVTPGGSAVDDPRLVATYLPSSGGVGNTPVSVDPDTGIVYGSETGDGTSAVNGFELAPPPLYAVADTDLDGSLEPVDAVVPLGVENASKTAAIGDNPLLPVPAENHGIYVPDHFSVLAFLPGGVGESVDVEVVSTNLRGYDLPASAAGFPRSGYLRASLSRPDTVPITLRRSSDDPSDRAFNRFQSDAVTVLADPRARLTYERSSDEKSLPGEKGKDNPYSCRNCDVAKDLAGSLLSSDGKRAELWSGDLVRVSFTDDVKAKLAHLGSTGLDLASSSLSIPSVRGDLTPGLRQSPRESSSVGATDAAGVDLASGEEHLGGVDLRLAGRGLDFVLSRSYASQALHDGPLGRSWDSPLFARLRFLPNGDVDLYDGTARRDTFRLSADGRELIAPPGLFAHLTKGKDGFWYLKHADKSIQRFDVDGRLFEIWDPVSKTAQDGGDGNRVRLLHDGAGRLTAVLDTLDHAITFDSFTEPDLVSPGVLPASLGRLKRVTDHTGRTVEYRYDDKGRLTRAFHPELKTVALGLGSTFTGESGRPSTTYAYPATPSGHPDVAPRRWLLESDNVRSVFNARAQETLRLTYEDMLGSAAEDVVTRLEIGGKPVKISYTQRVDGAVRADVEDRRGHHWVTEHTKAGHIESLVLPTNGSADSNSTPSVALPTGPLAPGPIETRRKYTNARDGLAERVERPGKEVETFEYQKVGVGAAGRRAAANVVTATVTVAEPSARSRADVLTMITRASYDPETNDVSTLTLPGDRTTRIDYIPGKGLPETITPPATFGKDPAPDGTPRPISTKSGYQYDDQARNGQLRSVTDAANVTWGLDYFEKGQDGYGFVKRLFTDSEPSIEVQFTRRDGRGNVLSETNARGVVTERVVDEYDRVVEERRAVAAPVSDGGPRPWVTLQRSYDKDGNLEWEKTTDGKYGTVKTVRYQWDALGRLESRTENPESEVARTTSYEYDSTGSLVVTTDPEGARTAVAHDARGLPVAVTRVPAPGRGETPTATTTYLRDARGNVLEEFDGVNTKTSYQYDGLGRRSKVFGPRGAVTTIEYDAASRPSIQTTLGRDERPLQKVETTYTPAGDVYETKVTVYDPEGSVQGVASTRNGYDGRRRPVSRFDPLGRLTTWEYDDVARKVKKTDPAGNVVTVFADENGNPVEVVTVEKTPGGGVETIRERATWDALDRPMTRTDGLGKTSVTSHDGLERVIETVDPEGVRTKLEHDLRDRVTKKVEDHGGLGLETITTYNRWDLVESLTDAREALLPDAGTRKRTEYTYDGLGRLTKTTWADGTSRTNDYNLDGTVYRTTDERGNVTTFTYGPDDQVERADIARAAGTPGFTYEATTYDELGRPVAVATDAGLGGAVHTVTKRYDSRGLVLSEGLDGLGSVHEYDLSGNRTMSAYPSGLTLRREFDARDTLQLLAEMAGSTKKPLARFDPWGIARTGSIVRPSGPVTAFGYDLRRLPESMSTRLGGASPVNDLAYSWGDARELVSETRLHEGRADVYAFDRAYRMTAAGLGQAPATTPDLGGRNALSLTIGRVSSIDGVLRRLDGSPTVFANETTPRHRYSLFHGQRHDQDPAGNETRNGRGTFEWDARNRLVKATTANGTTLEYGYDALGRRIERRQTTLGTPVSTRFVYDGFEPIQEWSCDACDTATPSYSLFREYVPSGGLDRPLEVINHSPSGRFLLFPNVVGSITLVTDESGRPVERVRYLPHGAPTFDSPVTVRSISSPTTGGLNVELAYGFDPATVASHTVLVSIDGGAAVPATVTPAADGRTIHIRDLSLAEATRIRLTLTAALSDSWGGTNGVDFSTTLDYRTGGTLFERQDYALDRTSRVGLSRLWQGLEYEPALGLYYVRHRWYDPETGSFLSADPLGFPDGMNQYTWPYANPWKQDPWGLESGATFGAIDRRDRGVSAVPPSYTAQEKAAAAQRLVGCLAFGGGAAWTAFSGGALGGVLGGFALMSSGGATCFGKESPIGMVVRETSDAAAKSQGVQMTPAVAQQQAANNAAVEGAITTGLISYGAIAPQAPATGVRTDGPPAPVMRKPSPAPADSPYVTRFDSRFPGRPDPEWSIDTRAFATGEPTAAGGIRNRTEFWTEWLRRHPETISKGNRFLIEKKGLSPRVDDHWISYFPEHAPYARETLFHHHVDQGPYAVPVPSSTHPGSGGPFHAP